MTKFLRWIAWAAESERLTNSASALDFVTTFCRSERSRHINIRHIWVAEKLADGNVVIEHMNTDMMYANALTKHVQGAQFER